MADEADLVARLRSRCPDAFAELIRRYGVQLMATTRRILREEHEANDALQETLVSAFKAIGSYEGRAPLGGWLEQIAVNACLMRLRSRRARHEEDVGDLLPDFSESGAFAEHQHAWSEAADVALEREEVAVQVRAAIAALPDKYRIPLVLRDLQELDYATVAAHMNLSENAVKIRVHRGRQALRGLLEPQMGTC